MARRAPDPNQAQNQLPPGDPANAASLAPEDAPPPDAKTDIREPGKPEESTPEAACPESRPAVLVKRYRVMNEPQAGKPGTPILYDGCLTHLPKGKVVTSTTHDLELLRSQGIELSELA
jgi:hypothetical protein